MNNWQIIPKRGISLGEIQVTFDDSWQDVCQKLNLEETHGVFELHDICGPVLDNILNTKAAMRFEFQQNLLFEILFLYGNLFFDDINFINCEIEDVISSLRNTDITILYHSSERTYICPSLGINFGTAESSGGDGTKVHDVGISICPWELDRFVQEVTSPVSED
jgi:hypothetical protein